MDSIGSVIRQKQDDKPSCDCDDAGDGEQCYDCSIGAHEMCRGTFKCSALRKPRGRKPGKKRKLTPRS